MNPTVAVQQISSNLGNQENIYALTLKQNISSIVRIPLELNQNQPNVVAIFQQRLIVSSLKLIEGIFFKEAANINKVIQSTEPIKYLSLSGLEMPLILRVNALRKNINPNLNEALRKMFQDSDKKMIFDFVLAKSIKFLNETPCFLQYNDICAIENIDRDQLNTSKLLLTAIEATIRITSDKQAKIYAESIANKNWWNYTSS